MLVPVYTSELAPPALRGLFVGMDGLGIAMGYALATYMGLAFYHSTDSSTQWRGPYGVGLLFTALPLFVALFVAPESPRWLLMAGRADEAKKVVRDLHQLSRHHHHHDDDHHFAMVEFYQMQRQIEYDRTMNATYWQMFRKPSYRKRVIMTVGYAILGQSTAILGEQYTTNWIGSDKKADTWRPCKSHQQLWTHSLQCHGLRHRATAGSAVRLDHLRYRGELDRSVLIHFNVVLQKLILKKNPGALISDKVGRKPLMIFGIGGCLVCLCVEAAMVATYASPVPEHPNKAGLSVAIAAL